MKYLTSCKPDWNKIKNIGNIDYKKLHNNLICSNAVSNKLIKSFDKLPIDKYLINNNPPTRFRKFSKYNIRTHDINKYHIYNYNCNIFKQNVSDSRGNIRNFELIDTELINDKWIIELLTNISGLCIFNNNNKRINNIDITLHQIRQLAYPNIKAHNSPEGIHKDGADYIISAFVINKKNIIGGKSIIYNENKNKIYETIINNNEFIFQEDKNLWHYVTPIEAYDSNYNGIRDIIGLDIKIN